MKVSLDFDIKLLPKIDFKMTEDLIIAMSFALFVSCLVFVAEIFRFNYSALVLLLKLRLSQITTISVFNSTIKKF